MGHGDEKEMNRRDFFKGLAAAAVVAAIPSFIGPAYGPQPSQVTFSEKYQPEYLAWINAWTIDTNDGKYSYAVMTEEKFSDLPGYHRAFHLQNMRREFAKI